VGRGWEEYLLVANKNIGGRCRRKESKLKFFWAKPEGERVLVVEWRKRNERKGRKGKERNERNE